ncbi:MAG: polyribonucleotide nucleotidyltransferase [Proteobacteria bacterium]|nr:polyribonucleotide nucleotidyltransferase [Pseudomonadota bacterium]
MSEKLSEKSKVTVEAQIHGEPIIFESGWVAKQAGGSVIVKQGETMILVTVCSADAKAEQDFFPLVVEYQERAYAAGKIPGGFFRREGKPAESEILTCRLIDRPIRPLFPEGYMDEVQLICTVLSADGVHSPDVLAICGASAALHLSSIPFLGPIAAVRVGKVNGKLIINPLPEEAAKSEMDFVIAGSKDAIVMVEGGAKIVPEKDVLEALFYAHSELQKIIQLQEDLRAKIGKPKKEFVPPVRDAKIEERVKQIAESKLDAALSIVTKAERKKEVSKISDEVKTTLATEFPEGAKEVKKVYEDLFYNVSRQKMLREKKRLDGRTATQVRPIECEVGILPRAHGSALFTRGETQAIVTTTLGTSDDAQRIDSLTEQADKVFMLHYNFPPYSTGEVKMMRGTGRREVGHGNLAERALRCVAPSMKDFPYVIRIVSDITESNGSSSMASVCGGSMSMMAAGVPIKEPVGGVAMGLIKEGNDIMVLTDILGDEDHFGDMDFKVCGTKDGVTALQMDIKCSGLTKEIMGQALDQAKEGRLHILGEMAKAISETRTEMSKYAPQIKTIKINPDKIRDVIGPGGKMIRSITETTGAKIEITDDGTVNIASTDPESGKRALEIILSITAEAEIGKVYSGIVKRIADFGAFVEILPGTEGLVHISQLANHRVEQVTDVVREGDEVAVKVLDIDRQGRIRLSVKEAAVDA